MKRICSKMVTGFFWGVLVFGLVGCGGGQKLVTPPQTIGTRVPDAVFTGMPKEEGSLWNDSGSMLFVDQRARRVGDTVIIDVVENATSRLDANTSLSRESSTQAGIPNALGYMTWLQGKNANLVPANLLNATTTTDFTGAGSSDRSGRITASIGARVLQVLPNGNVVVHGTRELKVNNETQTISVLGTLRPKDIGPDNRVKSTFMADAKIEYSGSGTISEKQKPGWLSRMVDRAWPF